MGAAYSGLVAVRVQAPDVQTMDKEFLKFGRKVLQGRAGEKSADKYKALSKDHVWRLLNCLCNACSGGSALWLGPRSTSRSSSPFLGTSVIVTSCACRATLASVRVACNHLHDSIRRGYCSRTAGSAAVHQVHASLPCKCAICDVPRLLGNENARRLLFPAPWPTSGQRIFRLSLKARSQPRPGP